MTAKTKMMCPSVEELVMAVLMVTCPTTHREFSSGVNINEDSFERLPKTAGKVLCPHCGHVHIWWPREAALAHRVPPKRWVEKIDPAA
jgi:hypothetical protein